MMKKIALVSSAAALLAATAAIAQPHGMRADADGDGSLTRAELNAALDARFARADANGDGAIDQAERDAARAERRERMRERRAERGRDGRRGGRMARLDTNGDGVITRDEVPHERGLAIFDRVDTNGDGQIDQAERSEARNRMRERRAEWRANRPNPDANGDGLITRDELATLAFARFDRTDTNGDGVVTREERQAARAARRAERRGG